MRQIVRERLEGFPSDVVESAVTTASELAENLVKYGQSFKSDSGSLLALSVERNVIRFRTENRASAKDIDRIRRVIDELAKPGGPGGAYRRRLRNLLSDPDQTACGLGLIRIAHEGGFELKFSSTGQRLELIAERRVEPRGN